MENQIPSQKTFLSLEEAAQLLGTESLSVHDAEVSLIHAIEHGMLAANIKRWSTEQWDDKQFLATSMRVRPGSSEPTWKHGRRAIPWPDGFRQTTQPKGRQWLPKTQAQQPKH